MAENIAAALLTKGAMASQDGEKSTGKRIFCIVTMCSGRTMAPFTWLQMYSGFAFARFGPEEPRPRDTHFNLESRHLRERLNHDLVDVTPAPVFAGL